MSHFVVQEVAKASQRFRERSGWRYDESDGTFDSLDIQTADSCNIGALDYERKYALLDQGVICRGTTYSTVLSGASKLSLPSKGSASSFPSTRNSSIASTDSISGSMLLNRHNRSRFWKLVCALFPIRIFIFPYESIIDSVLSHHSLGYRYPVRLMRGLIFHGSSKRIASRKMNIKRRRSGLIHSFHPNPQFQMTIVINIQPNLVAAPPMSPISPGKEMTPAEFLSQILVQFDSAPSDSESSCFMPVSNISDNGMLMSPPCSPVEVDKKLFPCGKCSKSFTTPYALKSHETVHTDARPFKCTICRKSQFKRSWDFKRHVLKCSKLVARKI